MKFPALTKPALSPFIAIGFTVISATGILLFFHVKNGPVMVLHEWFGWAFVLVGLLHVALNLRPLLSYLKLKSGRLSLILALGLTLALGIAGVCKKKPEFAGGRPPAAENR